jgi:hypothetical protein
MATRKPRIDDVLGPHKDAVRNKMNGIVPPGEYTAEITDLRLDNLGRKGTPCCFLDFRVCDGESAGKTASQLFFLTENIIKRTLLELKPLGITTIDDLDSDIPPGIIARITVVPDDFSGSKVSRFEVDAKLSKVNFGAAAKVEAPVDAGVHAKLEKSPPAPMPFAVASVDGWSDDDFASMDAALAGR